MEFLTEFIFNHVEYAHWIIFFALMIAGCNVPISEDLMIIISGVLAAQFPNQAVMLFVCAFLGAYLSDWEAYWIGRILGDRVFQIKWFSKRFRENRREKIRKFYDRNGVVTLIIGRFIPFGVRNCLFMTAGIAKMPFIRFIISDGIACVLSTCTLFYFSYTCGKNSDLIYEYVLNWSLVVSIALALILISFVYFRRRKKPIKEN